MSTRGTYDDAYPAQSLAQTFTSGIISAVTGVGRGAAVLNPTAVAGGGIVEQTFAVAGVLANDIVTFYPPAQTSGYTLPSTRVVSAGAVAVTFANPGSASVTPNSGTYPFTIIR